MKRFQECNKLEKMWRYRWYLLIPFQWAYQYPVLKWKDRLFLPEFQVNGKTLWGLLISEAQHKMKWHYTQEEVWKELSRKHKIKY